MDDGKRHGRIGGTDVAAILGLNPWRTKLDVYNRIVHGLRDPMNPAMQRGLDVEPVLRAMYVTETGVSLIEPHPGVIASEEHEFAAVSPDDWAVREGGVVTVDYKSASVWTRPKWDEGMLKHYELQLIWAMAIGNKDAAELYVGFGVDGKGDEPAGFKIVETRNYELERDLEVESMALEAAGDFWSRHILSGTPPAYEANHPKNTSKKKRYGNYLSKK